MSERKKGFVKKDKPNIRTSGREKEKARGSSDLLQACPGEEGGGGWRGTPEPEGGLLETHKIKSSIDEMKNWGRVGRTETT